MISTPLKWVGGKKRIVSRIYELFPKNYNNFWEPFLGGGSIFLYTYQYDVKERSYHLSDLNEHLMKFWVSLRDDFDNFRNNVIDLDRAFTSCDNKKEFYHSKREEFNGGNYDASLYFFLMRMSFNGLVRYNKSGKYNSAFGRDVNGNSKFVYDLAKLRSLSELFSNKNITLNSYGYEKISPKEGDFVICDPPYLSINERKLDKKTYSVNCDDDIVINKQLAEWCKEQSKKGILIGVCNHDTELLRSLYPGWRMDKFDLVKTFSGKASSREKTAEVFVMNY